MIPENEGDLENIIKFGKEHDIPTRVATYMFPPVRRTAEDSDSRFTPKEAADLFIRRSRCYLDDDKYYEFLSSELRKIGEPIDSESDEIWGSNLEYMRCRAGRSTFWISWEGKMTACGMLDFPMVEYPFKKPFKECWLNLTNTVRTTKVMKECNLCEKKEVCNPCVAMLYSEHGDVNKKAPYMCEMTDLIIENIKKIVQENKTDEKESK